MNNGRVAIIGGEGFLGQALIRSAIEKKIDFVSFDLSPAADTRSSSNFRSLNLLEGCDPNLLVDCGTVINLTGQVSNPLENCIHLNSTAMVNLLKALHSHQRFIQISSVSVYGSCQRASESSPINPGTPYGAAKALAEKLIGSFLPESRYAVLRLPNLYGPMQRKGVLAYLLRAQSETRELQFDNDGSLLRYYLHVDDGAEIVWEIQKKALAGVYNLPGEGPYSIRQLVALAEDALNIRYHTSFSSQLPPDNIHELDFSKLRNDIAFSLPRTIKRYLKGE